MNYELIIIFFILQLVNVILQTIKILLTVSGSKLTSAIINSITYGVYTIVLIYTNSDFPLVYKVVITMITNFIGVYISKILVDKFAKSKIWKIETAILKKYKNSIENDLQNISFNKHIIDNEYIGYNFYCNNSKVALSATKELKKYNAKYFITENKI